MTHNDSDNEEASVNSYYLTSMADGKSSILVDDCYIYGADIFYQAMGTMAFPN
jgi:hypothetical protein